MGLVSRAFVTARATTPGQDRCKPPNALSCGKTRDSAFRAGACTFDTGVSSTGVDTAAVMVVAAN
jgi:hypothetical protein